jgi:hypothetical protein
MLSDRTLAYGEDMIAVLLGVDKLVRASGGDEDDGLVVLNMAPEHRPEELSGFEGAAARLEELRREAAGLPEADRRRYYDQLCLSTLALLDWRQGRLPFTEQISRFLHVPAAPVAESELDGLCAELRELLSRMGYSGDLSAQCESWQARTRVPADEVPGVLQELLDEAWDRTVERMEIPADRSDGMKVTAVSGAHFNARCDYLGRSIELNTDPVLTRPGLKHLAVHEGYPGHYVQFKLREVWYREGIAAADGLLSIVNSASSSPFEGIADNGMHVIDWIESDDDRVSALMSRYRSGLGTAAAWRLHGLGRPEQEVQAWLAERSLVGGDGWAANRLRFIAAPQRAALIWSYWWGERTVEPVWRQQPPERQSDFLRYLYGRMHSVQTVGMFDAA